jgi:hypothetical protein
MVRDGGREGEREGAMGGREREGKEREGKEREGGK